MQRRRLLQISGCLPLLAGHPAHAQSWPSRPTRVIVGFPAGGVVDVMARAVTDRIAPTLGQPLIIETRPGAGGSIGVGASLAAPADGHTWLVSSNFLFVNPATDANAKWKLSDFEPVARYALSPSFLLVPASSGWKSLRDLVAHARKNPGLRFGDGGAGTTQALALQMLALKAGLQLEPVGYKGAPPMVPDLAAGLLQLSIIPSSVALSAVATGRVRALATTGEQRSPHLPDVPTLAESGYPEATALSWYGIHVLAGTPPAIVQRIGQAIQAACASTEVRARLFASGGQEAFLDSSAFKAYVDAEARRWLKLLTPSPR